MSKQNSMSHSPVEELYINADNFDKAKKILTQKGIDCTDRKLTEVLSLKSQKNFRTIQRYRSKEKQTPIFLTRNGDGEMVFLPIELWEKREAELDLLAELLRRERSMLAGAKTADMSQMHRLTEDVLGEN